MNVREVALELTDLVCQKLNIEKPEDVIEIYKKCYRGVVSAEDMDILYENK
jgi:hypothetical protein